MTATIFSREALDIHCRLPAISSESDIITADVSRLWRGFEAPEFPLRNSVSIIYQAKSGVKRLFKNRNFTGKYCHFS